METQDNITDSYLGIDLNLEDTARLVGQLRSGIPKKIDNKFAKLTEENEALKHRVEVLEANHVLYKKYIDQCFERERLDMRAETSRNIAALDASFEDKGGNNDWQASTSTLAPLAAERSPASPTDDTSHNRAVAEKKIRSLKQEIASAAGLIFNEPVQVMTRTHRHWQNSGDIVECFIAFISGIRPSKNRLKILFVGTPEVTELESLRGLKNMVKKCYEAADFPFSTGDPSDIASESSRGDHATPSRSTDEESNADAEASSTFDNVSVERDDSGHPRKGRLRPA
ncbi:MAG: hypothetical protein Q9165_007465 [Trypethelium subeluteriae]